MSIQLFTGFVGSGKSYAATKVGTRIADAPIGNRYVIANFPIKPKPSLIRKMLKKPLRQPKWIFKKNDELTPKYLIKLSLEKGWNKKEGSCLVIFDEASIPFNSRNWNKPDRLEWVELLSQSRKFGYDFIFITQDAKMIDKQIRSLCEFEVQHKRLNEMFPFQLLSLFRITLFAGVKFWNGLGHGNKKGSLSLYFFEKRTAGRYDTLNLFGFADELEEPDKAVGEPEREGAGSAGGSPGSDSPDAATETEDAANARTA